MYFIFRLLLKGIIDINVPKFVSADMQLYKGIIQDLFPKVKPPQIERKTILTTFEERCKKNSLQATPWFSEKVTYHFNYVSTFCFMLNSKKIPHLNYIQIITIY